MIILKDRVTLVTGASRGIGRATALLFARAGSDVVIHYSKSRDSAHEVKRLAEEFGVRALAHPAEIGDRKQVDELVDRALQEMGQASGMGHPVFENHIPDLYRRQQVPVPAADALLSVGGPGGFGCHGFVWLKIQAEGPGQFSTGQCGGGCHTGGNQKLPSSHQRFNQFHYDLRQVRVHELSSNM